MMPVSVRRVNAESWMVLEISSSAASACTSAMENVALRIPLSTSNSRFRYSAWSTTLSTPGRPVNFCCRAGKRAWSDSLTRSEAGIASARATSRSSGCDAKTLLKFSNAFCRFSKVTDSTPEVRLRSDMMLAHGCWVQSLSLALTSSVRNTTTSTRSW